MNTFDLLIEIDKFINRSGLTNEDSIKDLINALAKEIVKN